MMDEDRWKLFEAIAVQRFRDALQKAGGGTK
jgi:hypothetical protein